MEAQDKKSCRSDGSVHPDGSKVCCEGYCLVCKDGRWMEPLVQKESF